MKEKQDRTRTRVRPAWKYTVWFVAFCATLSASAGAATWPDNATAPANLGGSVLGQYVDARTGKTYDGTGYIVVDIDGAFHTENPVFKGFAGKPKIVAEACFGQMTGTSFLDLCRSTTFTASNLPGRLSKGYYFSSAVDSSRPSDAPYNACRAPNLAGVVTYCHDYHGTATASLIAGQPLARWEDSQTKLMYTGVAPGAEVIAIKIGGGSSAATMGWPIDSVVDGLNYVNQVLLANPTLGPKIVAVNLSVGGGVAGINDCKPGTDGARINDVAAQLKSKNVAVVMAAGNDGGAVGSWACGNSVIAVGASGVKNPMAVASYSNASSKVALYAPVGTGDYAGRDLLLAAYADGGSFYTWGTSFASPQVAGAFAVLRQRYGATPRVDELVTLLQRTGYGVSAYPRKAEGGTLLNIGNAISGKVTIAP